MWYIGKPITLEWKRMTSGDERARPRAGGGAVRPVLRPSWSPENGGLPAGFLLFPMGV